jgi:hypothetical protein
MNDSIDAREQIAKVVPEGDDLLSATRYALMMLRFASTKIAYDKFRRKLEYPKVSLA